MTEAMQISYAPGSWVVVAGPRSFLLAEVDPAEPIVGRCWELVRDGADIDLVLEALVVEGLHVVRSFAAVQPHPTGARAVVRGDARVEAVRAGGDPVRLDAGGAAMWLDRTMDGPVVRWSLTGDPAAGPPSLPLAAGVALAAGLTVEPSPDSGSLIEGVPGPASLVAEVSEPDSAPAPWAAPPQNGTPAPDPTPVPPWGAAASDASGGARFDHLFGATVLPVPPLVEAAAVADAPAEILLPPPDEPPAAPPVSEPRPEPPPAPAWPRHQAPVQQQPYQLDEAGVIQGIPFSSGLAPAPPAPAPAPAPAGPTGVGAGGGQIPPEAQATRLRSGAGVARRALGVLRLATGGEPISLDRAVILGRAPDPAAGTGTGRANAIKLDAAGLDVSRSHVEFRADGWELLVTDLGSANGTTVAQPGLPPVQLERRQPLVVQPGAVVTLAGEVSLRYEVAQ